VLIEDNTASNTHRLYNSSTTVSKDIAQVLKAVAKAKERTWIYLRIGNSAGYNGAYFNLSNGTIGTVQTGITATITAAAGGYYECTVSGTPSSNATTSFPYIGIASNDNTESYSGDGTSGVYVQRMAWYYASTIDQSYQRITDWTTEQYAWAATKNVPWLRRNLLTYTESFAAGWTRTNITAGATTSDPFNQNTATTQTYGSTPNLQSVAQTINVGQRIYVSVYLKYVDTRWAFLYQNVGGTDRARAWFDIQNGVLGTTAINGGGVVYSSSIEPAGNGYYLCKASFSETSGASMVLAINPCASDGSITAVSGSLIPWGAQVAYSDVPYQRISTTWPAEYTSLALAAGYPISLYSDRAGTTATVGPDDPVGKLLDLSGDNNHATAPSDAARPNLRLDGNGRWYLDRDTTDDNLPIVWPTNLTSTGVIYTATGDYTTKDSGLILSGATDYKFPQRPSGDYGRIVMAADSRYDAKIIKYLDAKRGRSYLLGPELWNTAAVTLGGEATQVSSGVYRIYSSAGAFSSVASNGNICISGKSYLISFVVDSVTVAGSGVTGNIVTSADPNTNGVIRPSKVSAVMVAGATGTASVKRTAGVTDIQVSNISVREILL
jgi:hypothetical protein